MLEHVDDKPAVAVRAWIEVPPDWGWGPAAALKTRVARDGYHVEEHRGTGLVMVSVQASPGRPEGAPPGWSPWWREPLLGQADPGSLLEDTVIWVDEAAEVELRNGAWVRVRAGPQWRDDRRRWCVKLRLDSGEGVYVFDPAHVRRGL